MLLSSFSASQDWGRLVFLKRWELSQAKEKGISSVPKKCRLPRDSYPISGDPSISRAGFAFTKPKEVTGGVPAQDVRML